MLDPFALPATIATEAVSSATFGKPPGTYVPPPTSVDRRSGLLVPTGEHASMRTRGAQTPPSGDAGIARASRPELEAVIGVGERLGIEPVSDDSTDTPPPSERTSGEVAIGRLPDDEINPGRNRLKEFMMLRSPFVSAGVMRPSNLFRSPPPQPRPMGSEDSEDEDEKGKRKEGEWEEISSIDSRVPLGDAYAPDQIELLRTTGPAAYRAALTKAAVDAHNRKTKTD